MKTFRLLAITCVIVACYICSIQISNANAEDAALLKVKTDKQIQIGMYLGFEGLSFRTRGKLVGLEVELAQLFTEKLSAIVGETITPNIVNQEWSQIIKALRDGKYDLVFSALIPSNLYDPYKIHYSPSYLNTGPTICTKEVNGKMSSGVSAEPASLKNKRIVVINDPAVRRVMRHVGIYVPNDNGKTDLERSFPKSETESVLLKAKKKNALIPVKEILQIDDMSQIYQLIADGKVDAGVIDLGIIWWVSTESPRWAKHIYAFSQPIGPYIYSAVTRAEDTDLSAAVDTAVADMYSDPRYKEILSRWHGKSILDWKLLPGDFLK